MLSLNFIRENPDSVRDGLKRKRTTGPLDQILSLDRERRQVLTELERLKAEQNRGSAAMAKSRQVGVPGADQAAIEEMRKLREKVKTYEQRLDPIDAELSSLLLQMPNLPHQSVPDGNDSSDNPVVREWGEKKRPDFPARPHYAIGEKLGILDFERGAKVATSRFLFLKGAGARLERALINLMLDLHIREHGYTEVLPPQLVNRTSMTGTGQLPKFEADLFRIEKSDLFLIPTAEVPVTNIFRDEILDGETLPIKLVAWSTNFRSEAGAAGKDTRGYIRLHQFNKVELVKFSNPAQSLEDLQSLVRDAEAVLRLLELPYRLIEICSGDLGFSHWKSYDIEVWCPGEERYLEVSSCSNYADFQARRANIRYREKGGKPQFVHTLNGSGLALPRTMVAIIENYQQQDGTVRIPAALRNYMGGLDVIR